MDSSQHDQIHLNDTPTSPSPEMFSFPGTPTEDQSEFEFGSCVTPDSPTLTSSDLTKTNTVDDFSTTSPADQFFLNGRLLPHEFPVVQTNSSTRTSFSGRDNMGMTSVTLSRGTSAGSNRSSSGSQFSSKDYSLMSSRSNSSNSSRGSTCSTCTSSTARTSSSEVLERKTYQKRMHSVNERSATKSPLGHCYKYGSAGSSGRWQFITAVPVLGPSQSRRGKKENGVGTATSPRMMKDVGSKRNRGNGGGDGNNNSNESFLYKILRSVVATCKACHAMEGQEKEFELDAAGDVVGH